MKTFETDFENINMHATIWIGNIPDEPRCAV